MRKTDEWREDYGKPLVNDELQYEGNIVQAWGCISARELVHRFWTTVMRGGYAGHGETYAHPEDLLWWAKGGELRGESWPRIGFLRDLIEADVTRGLDPLGRPGRVAVDQASRPPATAACATSTSASTSRCSGRWACRSRTATTTST